MRGQQTLFNQIFELPLAEKQRRGRSETFDTERNKCLIYRYHFIGNCSGYRYEIVKRIVAIEFWLSEVTVANVIDQNSHILKEARKNNFDRTVLKKRWPHLSWEVPTLQQYNICYNN